MRGSTHCEAFDSWLRATIEEGITADERLERLKRWAELAPSAREAHPVGAAEHLMPLLVVAGAAMGSAGVATSLRSSALAKHDPMHLFALSAFEFRDRFRIELDVKVNLSPFYRVHQPVIVKVRIVFGDSRNWV